MAAFERILVKRNQKGIKVIKAGQIGMYMIDPVVERKQVMQFGIIERGKFFC